MAKSLRQRVDYRALSEQFLTPLQRPLSDRKWVQGRVTNSNGVDFDYTFVYRGGDLQEAHILARPERANRR